MNNLWLEEWKQTTIFSNTLWFSNLNISNWPYVSIKHTRENTKQELLSFNSPIILFLTLIPACSFTYLSRNRWWEINCLLTKFHFNKKIVRTGWQEHNKWLLLKLYQLMNSSYLYMLPTIFSVLHELHRYITKHYHCNLTHTESYCIFSQELSFDYDANPIYISINSTYNLTPFLAWVNSTWF